MLTPNGGVFGRNPKFNNVTISGGATITPNATAPTSNVAIGPSAGALLNAAATNSVAIGDGALDSVSASSANIAIGANAMGAFTAGAFNISNTTPGTGGLSGGSGNVTGVVLEKDGGTGDMAAYPTVTLAITSGAVTGITITSPGTGATVQSGIVLKANAAGVSNGAPSDWRGTLSSVTGGNTAIGHNAGLLLNSSSNNTYIGIGSGDAATTGVSNVGVGASALTTLTTASSCVAIGVSAAQNCSISSTVTAIGSAALRQGTTGIGFATAVGGSAAIYATTGTNCTAVGYNSLGQATTATNTVAIGSAAGTSIADGSNCTNTTNSVFVGTGTRANANTQANQTVIGYNAIGDGANTTVINNSSTTSTRFAGTATSVLRTSGDTLRIDNARTPATAGAAGNAGDICWDADFIYVCIAANTWRRIAHATW